MEQDKTELSILSQKWHLLSPCHSTHSPSPLLTSRPTSLTSLAYHTIHYSIVEIGTIAFIRQSESSISQHYPYQPITLSTNNRATTLATHPRATSHQNKHNITYTTQNQSIRSAVPLNLEQSIKEQTKQPTDRPTF